MDARIETTQTLLSQTVDARAGLDKMVEKAEPGFRPIALKLRETHHQHAERIAAIVTAIGGDADTDGTVFSTVNRTVVSLRALFDDIDAGAMDGVRDGEARVLEAFDEAIEAHDASRHRDELVQMRTEIETLLRDSAQPG